MRRQTSLLYLFLMEELVWYPVIIPQVDTLTDEQKLTFWIALDSCLPNPHCPTPETIIGSAPSEATS